MTTAEHKSAVQKRLEESASKKKNISANDILAKEDEAQARRDKVLEEKVEKAKKLEGMRTPPNEKEDLSDTKAELAKKEKEAAARREKVLEEKKEKAKKLEGSAKKPSPEDLALAKKEAPLIKKTDNRDDAPVAAAKK